MQSQLQADFKSQIPSTNKTNKFQISSIKYQTRAGKAFGILVIEI